MPADYQSGPHGTWFRPGVRADLSRIDTLVFDVDGVLIDTEDSYPRAICQAVQVFFVRVLRWPGNAELVTPPETTLFKQAGGFNNDWHVARACALFYLAKAARIGGADLNALRLSPPGLGEFTAAVKAAGGGLAAAERVALAGLPAELADGVRRDWDQELLDRLCMEVYGGEDWAPAMFGFAPRHVRAPGLFNAERPLVDPARLARCGRRLGIYTGRVLRETVPALQLCRVEGLFPPEVIMAADGPHRKPDPGGLSLLLQRLGGRGGLFFGDNIDDCRTVLNYRLAVEPGGTPFWFAGVLGGVLGDEAREIFGALGADLITPSVNAVLDILSGEM